MPTSHADPTTHDTASIERRARRRARAKWGWWRHAAIYLLVNLGLVLLSWQQGRHWALFPLLGWGLGLLVHGLSVFWMQPGCAAFERQVARERAKLQAQQSTHARS